MQEKYQLFFMYLDNKYITDITYYTNKTEAKVINAALASNVLIYFSI